MEVKNLRRSESSNSMPSLISRLDHLDSAINDLESKKWSSARWRIVAGDVKRECVPLDWAIKEAQSKGSISDRITSLEERLNKLCLDIEPEAESPPSKISQVEQEADSPSISRARIFSNSFSRFRLLHRHHNHKQPISQVCINKFQETYDKNVAECQERGIEKIPNQIFYDTVSGRKKGKVAGLGASANLYFERSSRQAGTSSSSCTPSLVALLSARLEESKRARMEKARKNAKELAELRRTVDLYGQMFTQCSGFDPTRDRRDPDDPSCGSGGARPT